MITRAAALFQNEDRKPRSGSRHIGRSNAKPRPQPCRKRRSLISLWTLNESDRFVRNQHSSNPSLLSVVFETQPFFLSKPRSRSSKKGVEK